MSDEMDRPWVPEGARPFVVGDRVKVRLSGECRVLGRSGSAAARIGYVGHVPTLDGKEGTIVRIHPTDTITGHPFQIRVDNGYAFERGIFTLASLAASELELLEAAR